MNTTPSSPRLKKILDYLAGREEVSVAELVRQFQVAPMTVRRDLGVLEGQGRITRTHGGALLAAPSLVAFEFQERRQSRLAEKQAIARAAVQWVRPGMTVILDTGTTTLEVARALGGIPRLKVLTSSLAIASALLAQGDLELVLLGGTVSQHSPDLSGPLTEDNLAAFRAELAFVGADALDARGLYTRSQQIARVSRAMLSRAERTILVADSSKFGKTAFVRFAGWPEIDVLLTDDGLDAKARKWVEKNAPKHILAPVNLREKS
jgi:DeoR/GlpR family transcriptional regulator of sugar metabolism